MDVTVQLPTDPVERRRVQNRIAQRKFRLSVDDFSMDAYFDGNFDSCFDMPNLPAKPPSRSLSFDHTFSAPVRTPYSVLPTPRATASSSYASSSSSLSGRSHGTHVGEGGPPSSVSSVNGPSPRRETLIDTQISDLKNFQTETTNKEKDDSGASDKGWISTIHIAVQSGSERILGMLLRQDTDGINSPDSNGRTPLFHGAIQDNEPVVQMLLAHGARIGLLDKEGRSPLHWAVLYRRLEVLRTLLEHWNKYERDSFDIDAHDNVGWTPLHLAVERRFEAGVLLLMQVGANIKARAKMCPHTGKPMPFNVEPLGS
ncbi:Serine/threonine-protein phosphatase 6 regulatory ankyrin repeat subunit C [Beauveria bassiana]|nr:Serine/threonine-protein phosphatase 6 regulatory ankyrin repeat subunit C [Beauveria bassiana]